MSFDGEALFFSPWRFPPRTERLLELIENFRRLGYQTVIIDWGGLFPWSDACFQSRFSYPEHAVVEAHKRAADAGLALVPRFPFGGGMSSFLSNPAYANLRLAGRDPDFIDPAAPGAVKFLCDLLEDMRALLPALPGIYLDPGGEGLADESYVPDLLEKVFPGFVDAARGLTLIASASLAETAGASCICTILSAKPEEIVSDHKCRLPPTAEIYLHLMPEAPGIPGEIRTEVTRSRKLRGGFERFAKRIDNCWEIIREAAESSFLPPSLGYSPERSGAALSYKAERLKEILAEATESLDGFVCILEPLTAPGILASWIGSRIAAVEEQIGDMREKNRLVTVWIERE